MVVELMDWEPQDDCAQDESMEDVEENSLVGVMEVNVVGLQYYTGTVTSEEMVGLVREPENPYDRNAIRVENMSGEKVGHIERGKAMYLAPVVDSGLVMIEGVVSCVTQNRYKMPCLVYVFSKEPTVTIATLKGAGLRKIMEEGNDLRSISQYDYPITEPAGWKRKADAEEHKKRTKVEINDIFEMLSKCQGGQDVYLLEPSPFISSTMFQHQKEALAWLVQRENSLDLPPFWEERGAKKVTYKNIITNFTCEARPQPLRGGILADDMGLGKTLVLLALVLTNKPGAGTLQLIPVNKPSLGSKQAAKTFIAESTQSESSTFSSKKRKLKSIESISHLTLNTVETPNVGRLQVAVNPAKKKRKIIESRNISLSAPTAYDGCPRATLVICPVSVLSNWMTQVEEHTVPGSISIHVYYGCDRLKTIDGRSLSDFDIVLTSYNIVSREGDNHRGPLQRIKWLRILLDEAHIIKSPNTKLTKSVVALKSERKWAVTGTPIQNSAQDLFSFMMFLQLQPVNERSFWNRIIQRPLSKGEQSGFIRLQALMSAISLRRTKETQVEGKRLIDLPRKTISIYKVNLSDEDRHLYDKVEWEGRQTIDQYMASGTVLQNYATVLQIILRLRQICDHSALCPSCPEQVTFSAGFKSEAGDTAFSSPELLQKLLSMLQSGDEFECPICLSPPSMAVITRCAHMFCRSCIEKSLTRDKEQCPLCRALLTVADLIAAPVEEDTVGLMVTSTKSSAKIDALLKLILEERVKDQTVKSVVFSQFTRMLDQVQRHLEDAGIRYVRMDGRMTVKRRAEAICAFNDRDAESPLVFLLSLKAAGIGLNLVAASRVYMLDPWWNPAVEEQAMDRVHRLGQTRDVEVIRLIVADSIEERILQMQEKKQMIALCAFDKKSLEDRRQMRIGDVQLLMRL